MVDTDLNPMMFYKDSSRLPMYNKVVIAISIDISSSANIFLRKHHQSW